MGRLSDRRMARVVSLLRKTLSTIISEELKDPRIGIFSLTDIRLARDMSFAEVKVSVVGGMEASRECCEVLDSAGSLLWNRLRSETDLRTVPKLRFVPDRSAEYYEEIDSLLKQAAQPADELYSAEEDEPLIK